MAKNSQDLLDGDALFQALYAALVDRANGLTPDTIRQPVERVQAPAVKRKSGPLDLPPPVPPRKGALETLLENLAMKKAEAPTDADLRRMYDVVQEDAKLTNTLASHGFGRNGDAYRRAAVKMHVLSLLSLLRDGKNIRNDIVHKPGHVPSIESTNRALAEYRKAHTDFLSAIGTPNV